MEEIWKEYKTYYNKSSKIRSNFLISNFGNVKGEQYNGKKLEIKINKKGKRSLSNGSCGQIFKLVWEVFNGPIPKGCCIHHIDENPLNDRLDNLVLLTNAEHLSIHHRGKKMSDEQKLKLSIACKGRKLTDETKEKIGKASKGRKHTEEAKRKISETNKGHAVSDETRQAVSKANKGNQYRLGVKLSDETKEKIRLSLKKYHKNKEQK